MHYHKTLVGIIWQIMDIVHEQARNGSGDPTPDVLLARLVPFKEMDKKWETFTIKELLEMGINCVHEAAHSLYIKHVYNGVVAETFLGDALFGAADRTIPVEERVDGAVKKVQKLTTTTKATVGQANRGGNTSDRRGGGSRGGFNNYIGGRQHQYNRHTDYINDFRPSGPPGFGRFNGGSSFGGSNGGGRGNGGGTYFICCSTGYQGKQCPKA
jgi:hypothetical protein